MRRRGPDFADFRSWKGPNGRFASLLHSRLNIIDLNARSNQPFRSGSKWIAFNGEIYNYLELRKELFDPGVYFETESDTEVLLRVIEQEGWPGLDRCEGMWAFAVYDEDKGSILLGRDRFGEKPLYCYRDASGFYFGSEVKFIAALLGRRLEINYPHLYRYLVNGYKSLYKGRDTFFLGLSEVPRATVLSVEATGREDRHVYWNPQGSPDESMSYQEAVNGIRDGLVRAVELRLRADVPLAFCMSGGIDSNSLIGIAKNRCGYDVHGFTIVNTDARYEEQEMVEYAVGQFGIRHSSVVVESRDFLERLRTLVIQHDAPVYTITYFAHWLLMQRIAEQGYRISISGTGADELFTGYYDHHLAYLSEVKDDPALYTVAVEAWAQRVRPFVRNPFLQNPRAFIDHPGMRDHIFLHADEFVQYLRQSWSEPFTESQYASTLLRNRMLNEMFHENVPVILHEDDHNAMYYSLENRSPYLDRQLFEFCGRIPTRWLIREGLAKVLLRDAMRGIVPDRVLDNPRKVGFNAPILSFLDVGDPSVHDRLLEDSVIFDHVHRHKIEALLRKGHLPNSESKFLFNFVSSKLFLEAFAS